MACRRICLRALSWVNSGCGPRWARHSRTGRARCEHRPGRSDHAPVARSERQWLRACGETTLARYRPRSIRRGGGTDCRCGRASGRRRRAWSGRQPCGGVAASGDERSDKAIHCSPMTISMKSLGDTTAIPWRTSVGRCLTFPVTTYSAPRGPVGARRRALQREIGGLSPERWCRGRFSPSAFGAHLGNLRFDAVL